MKKILSLLMASVLIMGLYAAPVRKHASKKMVRPEKAMMRKASHAAMATSLTMDAGTLVSYGVNPDGTYNLQLDLFDGATWLPYMVVFIYPSSDTDISGTYNADNENVGIESSYFYFGEGDDDYDYMGDDFTMTITKTGSTYSVSGSFTSFFDEIAYTFSANNIELVAEDAYNFDFEPDEVITINYTPTSYELDDSDFDTYGVLYAYLDGSEYQMVLEFNVDNEIAQIPAGVYPIDATYAPNTVTASPGGDDMYDYGSYIMTDIDEEGYGAAYYLVSGTVTVSYDQDGAMTIAVAATTAKGSTVDVTYTAGPAPTPIDGITIVFADYMSHKDDLSFTAKNVTFAPAKGSATNNPPYVINENSYDARFYAGSKLTISYVSEMVQIDFYISEKGLKRQATITPSSGQMNYDMANGIVSWTGNASSVTFSVGTSSDYGTETGAGQFDFTKVVIAPASASGWTDVIMRDKVMKFIHNGRLMIRHENRIWDAMGTIIR
ncbi:MAG: hypothetical protein MJZ75_03865 [Paludibacteraceae bacterium]|nr:hypothetical protein [Paludibacteraceae bacterium]